MTDSINKDRLRPGDVLLYSGSGLISKAIKLFDGTEVSHAGIYLGDGQVGEALWNGVVRTRINASISDANFVLVRRLNGTDDLGPVLTKANSILDEGHRYAYEKLVLLALLSLTRKLKLTPVLRFLLRRILDAAAAVLATYVGDKIGGKRPMICSEFAYRSYDEALPGSIDAYTVVVNARPRKVSRAERSLGQMDVPAGQGVHPESLLAWAASPASRFWAAGARADRGVRELGRTRGLEVDRQDIEGLVRDYVEELQSGTSSKNVVAVSDAEMIEAVENFAVAHGDAISGIESTSGERSIDRSAIEYIPTALQTLFETAAGFVTPGDLYRTVSLFSVGQIADGARESERGIRRRAGGKAQGHGGTGGPVPVKRALIVGVNRYADPRANLRGCVNDALTVSKILTEGYEFRPDDIRLVVDERATTRNIRERLRWLVTGAAPGSTLVFHFSGHGSQVRDRDGDELSDGLDEIICPHDLNWDDPFTDDELARVIAGVPAGVNFTIILDCCHSGTGTREFFKEPVSGRELDSRFLVPPPDIAYRMAANVVIHGNRGSRTVNMRGKRVSAKKRFGLSLVSQNATLVAGCRDDQSSSDAWLDNDYRGALTYSLWMVLERHRFQVSEEDLVREAGEWLAKQGFDQVPQLERPSTRANAMFLGSSLPVASAGDGSGPAATSAAPRKTGKPRPSPQES